MLFLAEIKYYSRSGSRLASHFLNAFFAGDGFLRSFTAAGVATGAWRARLSGSAVGPARAEGTAAAGTVDADRSGPVVRPAGTGSENGLCHHRRELPGGGGDLSATGRTAAGD